MNKFDLRSGVTTAPADPAMRGGPGGLGGPKGPSKDAKTSTNIRKNPLAAGATPQTPPIYHCHHSNLLIHTWGGGSAKGDSCWCGGVKMRMSFMDNPLGVGVCRRPVDHTHASKTPVFNRPWYTLRTLGFYEYDPVGQLHVSVG